MEPTKNSTTSGSAISNRDRKVNYDQLQYLLTHQEWQKADLETRRLMLQITGADQNPDLLMKKQQILEFPCAEVTKIDQFWVAHSQGKFGFSVILNIYQDVGRDYQKLAAKVGWYQNEQWVRYSDINYSNHAPKGHLPLAWLVPTTFGIFWLARFASPGWRLLLERAESCRLCP